MIIPKNPDGRDNTDSKYIFGWTSEEDLRKLPYAWDRGQPLHVAEADETAKGRLGYTITPYPGLRGLFQVYIKVTHPEIFNKNNKYGTCECGVYKFLVNL
jgi:hypothetical protein